MILPSKGTAASTHLDALRGLAAILVALGHARLLLIHDTSELAHLPLWAKPFYFITSLGPSSVMIFFVLSGFLIGSSVIRDMQSGQWDWARYSIARVSRIYTVLVPALVLGVMIDLVGLRFFGSSIVYTTPGYAAFMPDSLYGNISWKNFLGNLFSLQEILVPTVGSNHALWSLANEVWYYVMFPLMLAPSLWGLGKKTIYKVVGCLMLLAAILWMLTSSILLLFLVWFMGAGISLLPTTGVRPWHGVMAAIALPCWLAAQSAKIVPVNDLVTGTFAAALIYCLVAMPARPLPRLYEWLADRLSAISYTLYLGHTPVMVILAAMIIRGGPKMNPDITGMTATAAFLLLSIVYATGVWYLFERRTGNVRRWLTRKSELVWTRKPISDPAGS
jgi:peptidoglycan/LPS O-acetylase OafA/YrhL